MRKRITRAWREPAERTRVKSLVVGLITLTSMTAACGGGNPASPTAAGSSTAIAVSGPASAAVSVAVTTTWNCFAGSRAGIFAAERCATPVTIGARTFHALAGTPSTPAGLASSVNGTTVTLTWSYLSGQNPDASSFIVEAGSSSGLSNIASFDTGDNATSLIVTQVPAGTYFVRVRGRTFDGVIGSASNEVIVTVGSAPTACTSAPGAPTGLSGATNGSTVNLAWSAPSGVCAATSYVLEAGSSAGLSDLANFNTGSTTTSYSAPGVPAGTYFVRVRAANAAGSGAASNEVVVTVPGTPMPGVDVSGRWVDPDSSGARSGDQMILNLTQAGTQVTGTFSIAKGGLTKASYALSGSVSGSTFTFSIDCGSGSAQVAGTTMQGTITGCGATSMPLSATKQ